MTSVERVSPLSQSSDSYGRTDGLTEIGSSVGDESSTSVPRAIQGDGCTVDGGVRSAPPATECIHEMAPGTCSYCTGRDGGEAADRARKAHLLSGRRAIPAAWSGTCAGCGEHYTAGEPISKRNGDRGWRASCCLDDNGRPTA